MVGTRIKKLRQKRGLSVSELARRAGVSKSLISQIENGHANPSVETVRTVATVLEVPVFSLFLEEGGPQSALVRKNERIRLTVPGSETIRELLTTDLDREMVLVFGRTPLGPRVLLLPSPTKEKSAPTFSRGLSSRLWMIKNMFWRPMLLSILMPAYLTWPTILRKQRM